VDEMIDIEHSLKVGLSFGLTSAVITTLGLIVGLDASINTKMAVLGGILIIAIADAFSDALGIHVSEESENVHTAAEIWKSTMATFLSKFVFALTFAVPVLLFPLNIAVMVDIGWGFLLLAVFSYYIGKQEKTNPWKVVMEHILIGIVVITITHFVGKWVGANFV